MNIKDLIEESYQTATDKGWHEEKRSFAEVCALFHSEISEALEVYREKGVESLNKIWFKVTIRDIKGTVGTISTVNGRISNHKAKNKKPEGIPIELADLLIRVFDTCGEYGIDLEQALKLKMAYNKTRPRRHGGKVI